LIHRSGLLHESYYRSQFHGELKGDRYLLRLFPALHYALYGALVSKNPNPLFDTEHYRDNNPDVDPSGLNPLAHYLRYGAQKRLNPGPFFDTGYYLDQNPALASSGLNPLLHYFRQGRQESRSPNPLIATLSCVEEPLAIDQAEGRKWFQQGLGTTSVGDPRPALRPDRVIRFEWDIGGWNNIRMQVEVMVCLAERYNRALILPAPSKWYLIPGSHSHLFDYFDEDAFSAAVPVANTVRLNREEYLRQQDRESWYFPSATRMFGWYASILGSYTRDYALIHEAFRVRSDLLDRATQLLELHGLKPGGFLAAHVRRGDFQYNAMRYLSIEEIIEALRKHGADASSSLLIVSDAYDEELLDACRQQGWNPVCWATEHSGDARLAGVLDMLTCCLAWRFVGTRLSTFSNGIIQWRGYMSRVARSHLDAIPRFTSEYEQVPWWGTVDEHAWLSI